MGVGKTPPGFRCSYQSNWELTWQAFALWDDTQSAESHRSRAMLPNFEANVCGFASAHFTCLFLCGNWERLKNDALLLPAQPVHYF